MGEFVTSATEQQWYQWTYGVVPNGDVQTTVSSVVSTDDGTIWVFAVQPMAFNGTESEMWVGKVGPDGAERVFGNSWTVDPSATLDGALEDGKAPFRFLRESALGVVAVPVANKIWLYNGYADERWYVFDTETYDFTWVAGSSPRLSGEGVVDHQDGKQAKLELWSFAVHVGGFIYWMEKAAINTWQSSLYVMRRMSTVPPYGIETLPGLSANPAGFTGSTSSELSAWSEEVNPATGLRNYYNSDVAIPFEGYPWKLIHYDGYIYFGHVCEVRRVPVTGGSAETLLWGYTTPYDRNAAPTGTLYRDHESDYAETPEGAPNPNNPTSFPNDPHHLGTKVPELEGLNFSHYGWVVLDDDLLFVNASGASMEQFAAGNRWARLHLPTLIDSFDSDGPQRVNRESPQWVTISGGTAMWEQRSSWTAKVNALDLRWRDGGRPLMNAPMKAACVPTAGPLAGKLVFGFQVWSGDLTPIDFVYELASEWPVAVVSVLEPGFDLFEIDVTLLFEGRALKGYANTHTLNPADAPEEVQLS